MPPLLLDHNLSHRLCRRLADVYPDVQHVAHLGLDRADDLAVWAHARGAGQTIVTKDSDFSDLAQLHEPPPHVVWIRRGNVSTDDIEGLLREQANALGSLPGSTLRVLILA